jgi:hypothetical protein
MKKRDGLIIRLLQKSSDNLTVLIRGRDGILAPIDAVNLAVTSIPKLADDMEGPLAHNQRILVIEMGLPIRQEMEVR